MTPVLSGFAVYAVSVCHRYLLMNVPLFLPFLFFVFIIIFEEIGCMGDSRPWKPGGLTNTALAEIKGKPFLAHAEAHSTLAQI